MTRTILITRPLGDEGTLAEQLHELGHYVIHEPLTAIMLEHTSRMQVERALIQDPNAVILTSRHGAHALAALTELRDLLIVCVGETTAAVAQSHGFTHVSVAGGNVDKLIEFLIHTYDEGSQFVYISGQHIRVDLGEALAPHDMYVERIPVYDAQAATSLADTVVEQVRRGQIDGICLLSPRASQIFLRLSEQAGISEAARGLHAFCISEAAAAPLRAKGWSHIYTASEPTLASLVNCIDNAFRESA